jgi:hypothetical protein
VVAFVVSVIVTIAGTGLVFVYARRRPVGTPLTWGEAMIGALFVFALMFIAYGIMPHHWLAYADNDLQWRKDKIGIPAGPLGLLFGHAENDWVSNSGNVFFANGVPLLNGHLTISAEAIRDIVAVGIYGIALGAQIAVWSAWQSRGKERPKEIPTSAYGRPLVKKA